MFNNNLYGTYFIPSFIEIKKLIIFIIKAKDEVKKTIRSLLRGKKIIN